MLSFLSNLVHELETQDNRATAHPLYLVQENRRVWGIELRLDPNIGWIDGGGERLFLAEELPDLLRQIREEQPELSDTDKIDPCNYDYEEVGYIDRWVFVSAHLTEKAAQRYIDENRHNLTSPRIYVSSQHRCHEFNQLIALLPQIVEQLDRPENCSTCEWDCELEQDEPEEFLRIQEQGCPDWLPRKERDNNQ